MATIRHLRNAPIVEAIIDFRVSLPIDFPSETLYSARDRLRRDYPKAEERKSFEALFQLAGVQSATAQTRELGFHGVWLKSEDEKNIAQFRVDGFTFNRLNPYTSWEEIVPEAMKLWGIYVEIARPRAVSRLALRYINRLPLPGPGIELNTYILTAPKIPETVPQVVSTFSTRTVLEHPERRLMANVAQVLEASMESPSRSLLLDIDAYRVGDTEVSDEEVRRVLEALRLYKNQIFFGSLTEDYVMSFT
jgi:uncharacterized protein (TIGR04255 family)